MKFQAHEMMVLLFLRYFTNVHNFQACDWPPIIVSSFYWVDSISDITMCLYRTLLKSMPMQQKFFVPLFDVPLLLLQPKSAAQGIHDLWFLCTWASHGNDFYIWSYFCDIILLSKCSFVGRLFSHVLEASRPKSVLFYALSFCICLLDPKRLVASSYQAFRSQSSHGTVVTVSQDTVEGMLGRLGICYYCW